jgi:thymidine phosphorylase
LDHKRKEKPSFTSLIEKKRDGGDHRRRDPHIVDSHGRGDAEAQQAALAMAIFFNADVRAGDRRSSPES